MDFVKNILYAQQRDIRVLDNLENLTENEKFELFLESIKHNFNELFYALANECLDYDRFTVLITSIYYGNIGYARLIIENTELTEQNITVLTLLSEQLPAPWLIEYLNSYPDWYFKNSKFSNRWKTIPLTQAQVNELLDFYVDKAETLGNEFGQSDREKLLFLADWIPSDKLESIIDRLHTVFVEVIKQSDLSESDKEEILENSEYESTIEFLGEAAYSRYIERE